MIQRKRTRGRGQEGAERGERPFIPGLQRRCGLPPRRDLSGPTSGGATFPGLRCGAQFIPVVGHLQDPRKDPAPGSLRSAHQKRVPSVQRKAQPLLPKWEEQEEEESSASGGGLGKASPTDLPLSSPGCCPQRPLLFASGCWTEGASVSPPSPHQASLQLSHLWPGDSGLQRKEGRRWRPGREPVPHEDSQKGLGPIQHRDRTHPPLPLAQGRWLTHLCPKAPTHGSALWGLLQPLGQSLALPPGWRKGLQQSACGPPQHPHPFPPPSKPHPLEATLWGSFPTFLPLLLNSFSLTMGPGGGSFLQILKFRWDSGGNRLLPCARPPPQIG